MEDQTNPEVASKIRQKVTTPSSTETLYRIAQSLTDIERSQLICSLIRSLYNALEEEAATASNKSTEARKAMAGILTEIAALAERVGEYPSK